MFSGTHGRLPNSVGAALRAARRCRWCWRSAPRSPGIGYLLAGVSIGFCDAGGGAVRRRARRQHAASARSALVARAFAGPRSLKALGTYNFAGDIGKMTVPAAASLLLVRAAVAAGAGDAGRLRRGGGRRDLRG